MPRDNCQRDRFIRDCPSFPGSNKNIIRDELVSAIGSTLAIEGITLREEEIKESITKQTFKILQRKQKEILNSRNVYDYIKKRFIIVRANLFIKKNIL